MKEKYYRRKPSNDPPQKTPNSGLSAHYEHASAGTIPSKFDFMTDSEPNSFLNTRNFAHNATEQLSNAPEKSDRPFSNTFD